MAITRGIKYKLNTFDVAFEMILYFQIYIVSCGYNEDNCENLEEKIRKPPAV